MLDDNEERIRTEAYRLWELAGRPEGQNDHHWQEAAKSLRNGAASESQAKAKTVKVAKVDKVAKPKAPKAVATVVSPAPVLAVVTEKPKRAKAKKAAE